MKPLKVLLVSVIVQVQSWGVAGGQPLQNRVLLNGAPLTRVNQAVDTIIESMSVPKALLSVICVNLTSVLSKSQTLCSGLKCNVSFKN